MNIIDAKKVGTQIEEIRKKGRFTRKELSTLSGVGQTAIYELEKGTGKTKLSTFLKILTALNTKLILEAPFVETFSEEEQ